MGRGAGLEIILIGLGLPIATLSPPGRTPAALIKMGSDYIRASNVSNIRTLSKNRTNESNMSHCNP